MMDTIVLKVIKLRIFHCSQPQISVHQAKLDAELPNAAERSRNPAMLHETLKYFAIFH